MRQDAVVVPVSWLVRPVEEEIPEDPEECFGAQQGISSVFSQKCIQGKHAQEGRRDRAYPPQHSVEKAPKPLATSAKAVWCGVGGGW